MIIKDTQAFATVNTIILDEALRSISTSDEVMTVDGLVFAIEPTFADDGLDFQDCYEFDSVCSDVMMFLDSIGCDEVVIANIFGTNDELSAITLKGVANTYCKTNMELDSILTKVVKSEFTLDSMPARKSGYKRTQVVRKGKKVFVNKRMPGKKVILSPAQRRGLAKARLKAHSGKAKMNRAKSMRIAKR